MRVSRCSLGAIALFGGLLVTTPLLAEGALGEAGRLDHSFGSSGVVTTAIGNGDSNAGGVALQPDGKILAAGSAASDGHRSTCSPTR